jgi:hypothetical protein
MKMKTFLKLSRKRTKILDNILERIELVLKGKLTIKDKGLKKLNKELSSVEKQYKKALKNV